MIKNRNILVVTLLVAIFFMAVAYAAFATQLTLNGTAEISSQWDVKITSIVAAYTSEGCDAGEPTFTNTTVTFHAQLAKPGDYITYLITIQNAGTFNATLNKISFTSNESGCPAIIYKTREPNSTLLAGEETNFMVMVQYDENTVEMPEITTKDITGVIEYVQQ